MKEVFIKTAYDFITRIEKDSHVIIENDIDFEGRNIKQMGSLAEPFCGIFDGKGHTLSNIKIDTGRGDTGLFGVNKGEIKNLVVENLNITGADKGFSIGGICGINYGKVYGVNIKSGKIFVRAKEGKTIISAIAGTNYGELVNINSALDIEALTTGGSILSGGFAGLGNGGRYETLEVTGEYSFTGNDINVGLAAGELKDALIMCCRASSPMNLLNEEVYTTFIAKEENVKYDAFNWRDNRNDDRLLPQEESEMRDRIVKESLAMATFPWKPDRYMEFRNSNAGEVHHQVFVPGKQQYAPPYNHKFNGYESMKEAFNDDGTPKPWLPSYGFDGLDLYIGNDCSGNTYYSWATVANDFDFRVTVEMRPGDNRGCVAIPPCDGSLGKTTEEIMKANGNDVMAESMARAHKGDAINANYPPKGSHGGVGHTRVVTHSSVVYRDAYGKIEFGLSYMITTEQGDGLYSKGMGDSPSMSWLTDYHYPFLSLMRQWYMPISTKQILSGKMPKEEVSYEPIECKNDEIVYTGKVKSNFRIIKTIATVLDKDGNKVWQKDKFTAIHTFAETMDDAPSRETIREVDLSEYKPLWNPTRIARGTYTYTLDVLLSTGNTYRVCEKEFKMGKGGAR